MPAMSAFTSWHAQSEDGHVNTPHKYRVYVAGAKLASQLSLWPCCWRASKLKRGSWPLIYIPVWLIRASSSSTGVEHQELQPGRHLTAKGAQSLSWKVHAEGVLGPPSRSRPHNCDDNESARKSYDCVTHSKQYKQDVALRLVT